MKARWSRRIPGWASLMLALALVGTAARAAEPFSDSPLGPVVGEAFASTEDSAIGNQVALLSGGYEALLLRIHLIRQARSSIDIQTFIWTNDEVGRLMAYELIQAARRGVKVRLLADQIASDRDPATVAFMATAHPNLEVRHYRPPLSRLQPSLFHTLLAGLQSFHAINQRMHNKLMVVDGAVLVSGGRNIENTYFDHSTGMNFRDRDILVVGPVVSEAEASFIDFWESHHSVPSGDLVDVGRVIRSGAFPRLETREDFAFNGLFDELDREADEPAVIRAFLQEHLRRVDRVTLLVDTPGKSRGFFSRTSRITAELREALQQAETSIVMQTPYLIISGPAERLFRELRRDHPDLSVRVSTNSFVSTDNELAYSANYRLRGTYVDTLRFEIHEFMPHPATLRELFPGYDAMAERAGAAGAEPFLCIHAKSLVIDDRVAFVGSYNLDPRSENLNTEIGLLVEDAAFARELREQIERDMAPENSWVIGPRSLPLRLDVVNGLLDGILSLSPIDIWPLQNTSSFELLPGAEAVSPWDPDFHENYRDIGSFPGTDGLFSTSEIMTRLYKAVGSPLTPIL